jgi:hypothetical protein
MAKQKMKTKKNDRLKVTTVIVIGVIAVFVFSIMSDVLGGMQRQLLLNQQESNTHREGCQSANCDRCYDTCVDYFNSTKGIAKTTEHLFSAMEYQCSCLVNGTMVKLW